MGASNKRLQFELSQQGKGQRSPDDYEKEIYDLKQLLEISRSLCTTLELSKLIESTLYITMAQMRVVSAGIFLLTSENSPSYVLGNNYSGFEISPANEYSIPVSSQLVEKISVVGATFTIKELEEFLPFNSDVNMLKSLKTTLVVPLILKNRLNGILILGERIFDSDISPALYDDYEKNEISAIASLAAVAVNNASLLELSSTDMMTNLKLKYYFFNTLEDNLDIALNNDKNLSVIMFDIDFFKKFNDTYGHACGDYVLQTVAKIIKSSIRNQDLAARYGGEEFTVMLSNTTRKEGMQIADRIRKNISNYDFFYQNQHMKVTISGGLSVFSKDNNPVTSAKVLVDQADQALYISKRNGRNQITFADPALLAAESPNIGK